MNKTFLLEEIAVDLNNIESIASIKHESDIAEILTKLFSVNSLSINALMENNSTTNEILLSCCEHIFILFNKNKKDSLEYLSTLSETDKNLLESCLSLISEVNNSTNSEDLKTPQNRITCFSKIISNL